MKRILIPMFVAILLMGLTVPAAVAQPCVESYPDVINIGTSHCIQLCPGSYVIIELEGNRPGPEAVPILIMEAGCQTAYCNTQCTPIEPPDTLIFGGDPFFPEDWYGESDCLIIYMHWVHDNIWSFEIFSFCEGCFCITFDAQVSVELTSFAAIAGDNSVTITWATGSETNNDRFEIVRSGETVAQVASQGNGATGHDYSWTDNGVVNGTTYNYSLVAVDINGGREEVATQSATPSFNSAVITEYDLYQNFPNPFNPETSIAFDLVQNGTVKLAIYNVLGENVATLVNAPLSSGRHTVVFNGSNLSSGVYLYKLEVNGFANTKKLVLLK